MKIIGHKSNALKVLNIVFMGMLVVSIILFIVLPLLDYDQFISYLFVMALFVWLYLPYKEIKKLDKRVAAVVEASNSSLKFRDLNNNAILVKLIEIKTLKVSKLPFVKYGTIIITTELRKVKCAYVKDVLEVVETIEKIRDQQQ